jgi:hypothetical protein
MKKNNQNIINRKFLIKSVDIYAISWTLILKIYAISYTLILKIYAISYTLILKIRGSHCCFLRSMFLVPTEQVPTASVV